MRDVSSFAGFRGALLLGLGAALAACAAPPAPADSESFEELVSTASAGTALTAVTVSREEVFGDIAHYTIVVRLADTPSGEIAIHRVVSERAPWLPRRADSAIMLLHGDFSTFPGNFLPPSIGGEEATSRGLAGYLAEQGIDVWGVDRRWTRTAIDETDFSDYATMGVAEELADTEKALLFARALRTLTGSGPGRVLLGGFSHGAQLSYEYAGVESKKPAAQRHVKALVPIDIYDRLAPEDETERQLACEARDSELEAIETGYLAGENSFFSMMGELAESQPDEPSPLFDGRTNRDAVLNFVGRTWVFYPPTPSYHLAGGVLADKTATSLRYSPEARIQHWLAAAPPYQSMRESAELDAMWCGESPRPLPDHLADIKVPVYYVGAAGGFGNYGLYTVDALGSSDVTSPVISEQDSAHVSEDWGHADLLFADDAPTLVWEPLAAWIESH